MRTDCLGAPVTGGDEATLAAVDDFVDGFLAYEARAAGIVGAAERDPGHCLANAYAGLLWMLLEASDAPARAGKYLARAQAAAPAATRREQMIVEALAAWTRDDVPDAMRLCDDIAAEFPRDLVMVKINQYLNFNLGRFPQMLRAAEAVFEANRHIAYMHGMIAFAYEQCHLLDEAEAAARQALRMTTKEPWAEHALAHVLLTTGRIDEGARFLEQASGGWVGLNSFMSTHLWWHLALFYLSQGRSADVLAIHDHHVWGVAKDYSQDQIGAVSMLARLELAGIDVGERWADVGDWLARRGPDTTQPFLSVQYLYGLARAGREEADALMAAIRARSLTAPGFSAGAWREAALPLGEGLLAHARGDYAAAEAQLAPALAKLASIGGSHAQRDLFDLVYLDAVVRNGGWAQAQQILERRRASDRDGVPVNRALAEAYAALDLPREADAARARAEHTLARHASKGRLRA